MAYHHPGIPSSAHISGHPIHPMLIPFPIAYLVGALVTDLAYLGSENEFWAIASLWLLRAGVVMGIIAAIFGAVDFFSRSAIREHRVAWHHSVGNSIVLILALINLFLRNEAPVDDLTAGPVTLSFLTAAILLYTGWQGGELAYRYHVGSIPESTPGYATARAPSGSERRAGPDDRRGHPAM